MGGQVGPHSETLYPKIKQHNKGVGTEIIKVHRPSTVASAFNTSAQKAEARESLSLRQTWSTWGVPRKQRLHRETLFENQRS